MQGTGAGDDDWEIVCSAETIATQYAGDAVATYARMDKVLKKYNISVDESESPYPRPTSKVGVEITFHIDDEHSINMVEGAYPPYCTTILLYHYSYYDWHALCNTCVPILLTSVTRRCVECVLKHACRLFTVTVYG